MNGAKTHKNEVNLRYKTETSIVKKDTEKYLMPCKPMIELRTIRVGEKTGQGGYKIYV